MEQEEEVRATVAIPLVQRLDPLQGVAEQVLRPAATSPAGRRRNRSAARIEARVGVGEVVGLQPFDQHRALAGRMSIAGITMKVACSAGIPSLKSSFGSTLGGRNRVSSWFTSPTASSDSGSSKTTARSGDPP